MPTIAEVLKAAGLQDDQIKAIDAKAITAFEGMMTQAEQRMSDAELKERAAEQLYETQIAPALNDWGKREANMAAELAYYKTQAEKAKDGGFMAEAPPFKSTAALVVQPGNTGSPDLAAIEAKIGGAFGSMADLNWRYRTLYGREMPDAPTALAAEAASQRMSMVDYAKKKYGFDDREKAIAAEAKQKEVDQIRKDTIAERDKYWSERQGGPGGNPMVRQPAISRFAEIKKAQAAGDRPDPLKMSQQQRREATRAQVHQDIATQSANSPTIQ